MHRRVIRLAFGGQSLLGLQSWRHPDQHRDRCIVVAGLVIAGKPKRIQRSDRSAGEGVERPEAPLRPRLVDNEHEGAAG